MIKNSNLFSLIIVFILALVIISFIPTTQGANITLSSPGYTETTITLQWTESNDLVFYNYTIYYAMNVNGPWYPIGVITEQSITSTYFWGFKPSTTYYFYLEDNAWLSSTPSNTISVTTAPNPSLSITNIGETTVSLSWSDENVYTSLVPFDSYTILMGTNPVSLSVITTINNPSQYSYTVTGLSPGTTYYFQLYDTVGPQGYTYPSYSNMVETKTISPLTISITSSSTTTDVNQPVTLSANINGGIQPYTYQWYVNGNPVDGATSSSFSFTPTNSGTYNIYASVTDSTGSTQNSNTITINVNPPIYSPSNSSFLFFIIIIVLVIIIILLIVAFSLKKKKNK
ncbi:MAG: fibronectin type III domain-containing protein [Minisyncoccia bacterium]